MDDSAKIPPSHPRIAVFDDSPTAPEAIAAASADAGYLATVVEIK